MCLMVIVSFWGYVGQLPWWKSSSKNIHSSRLTPHLNEAEPSTLRK